MGRVAGLFSVVFVRFTLFEVLNPVGEAASLFLRSCAFHLHTASILEIELFGTIHGALIESHIVAGLAAERHPLDDLLEVERPDLADAFWAKVEELRLVGCRVDKGDVETVSVLHFFGTDVLDFRVLFGLEAVLVLRLELAHDRVPLNRLLVPLRYINRLAFHALFLLKALLIRRSLPKLQIHRASELGGALHRLIHREFAV